MVEAVIPVRRNVSAQPLWIMMYKKTCEFAKRVSIKRDVWRRGGWVPWILNVRREYETIWSYEPVNVTLQKERPVFTHGEDGRDVVEKICTASLTLYSPVVTICTASLTLYSPVVTICTASLTFNISTFCPTQCIYVFCVDLRTNSYYFPIQH